MSPAPSSPTPLCCPCGSQRIASSTISLWVICCASHKSSYTTKKQLSINTLQCRYVKDIPTLALLWPTHIISTLFRHSKGTYPRPSVQEVKVKSIENPEKNPKAIESWMESISELHRSKPPATVHYTRQVLLLVTRQRKHSASTSNSVLSVYFSSWFTDASVCCVTEGWHLEQFVAHFV